MRHLLCETPSLRRQGPPPTHRYLDLSFNRISSLDPATLAELPCLATLYLHTNELADWRHVRELGAQLRALERLSLQVRPCTNLHGGLSRTCRASCCHRDEA